MITPQNVNQLRIISLCNTIYKVLSKVVVNRMKKSINDIVYPFQTSFNPNRSIHENIVVANEMIHSMNKLKGNKGYLAVKIYLYKAYDMMN